MTSTAATAKLMTALVTAEETLRTARAEEGRTARAAERAAARVTKARAAHKEAGKNLAAAERTGKRVVSATARAARAAAKLEELRAAAAVAKQEATEARRAARAAARRVDALSRRAAAAAARTVGEIAHRIGPVAPAPEAERTLPEDQLPAVEEIQEHADRFADLDAQAKQYAKAAEVERRWLRQLPDGAYGRVTLARTAGRSILDGDQVALDYLHLLNALPPRKASRPAFKVAVANPATAAMQAGEPVILAA